VNYRCRRAGVSKVSGTFRGTFLAGARITTTLLRIATERSETCSRSDKNSSQSFHAGRTDK
jgi:hypothetical protein